MKGKQRNKCRKNTIGLRNLKLKLYFKNGRRKKKRKTAELQKLNIEAKVYNNNKKCD